ncbi:Alpha/Beta hydrolase protein [Dichotomocladium elegans]|nr:Alpha/Beta hydrolase protein [Dichotomocladium elegans]
MAWFDTRTVYLSASLCFLPVIALCGVLCLPLIVFGIVTFYFSAWSIHLIQNASRFPTWTQLVRQLPYRPSAILQFSTETVQTVVSYVHDAPSLVAYFKWRYLVADSDRILHTIKHDLVYSDADTNMCKLDLYYPDICTAITPMVIFIHGLSDSMKKPNRRMLFAPYASALSELGYIVAVPDYRPDHHDDVCAAIRWVQQHISAQHIVESEMIYILGHGSGAQLATQVVLEDIFEKVRPLDKSRRQANYTSNEKHDPSADDHPSSKFLPPIEGLLLFGGMYRDKPLQLIKEHRDLFEISHDLIECFPRILFVHGDKDTVVPAEESIDMYTMLGEVLPADRREQVDVRMRLYKKLDHARCITALVPRLAGRPDRMRAVLTKDIQDFIDLPPEITT